MKMLNNRLSLDVTAYQKRTKDALIAAVIAPSVGTGATTVLQNLGAVRNHGFEMLTNAQIIDRKSFAFDITINGSHERQQAARPRRHAAADRSQHARGRGVPAVRLVGAADQRATRTRTRTASSRTTPIRR